MSHWAIDKRKITGRRVTVGELVNRYVREGLVRDGILRPDAESSGGATE